MMFGKPRANTFGPARAMFCPLVTPLSLKRAWPSLARSNGTISQGNPVETNLTVPEGLTAEQVIGNYIKALGGEDRIGEVQDMTMDGMFAVGGMQLTFKRHHKSPNLVYSHAEMNGNVVFKQVFDGEKGAITQMGQSQPIEGPQLESLKIGGYLVPEMHYGDLGVQVSLEGAEKIDGALAYKVKRTYPGGRTSLQYFDAESGLKLRDVSSLETPQGEVSQITEYKDYREVNGMQWPYKTVQNIGPQVIGDHR